MTIPRSQLISLDATPYYHCIARCVRRSYLCGDDPVTGKNFDHRKQWLVERIQRLSTIFSLDICAYAVMSNHYHLVLRINREATLRWTNEEVVSRWSRLYNTNALISLHPSAQTKLIQTWRERLSDISWFMRCLNESISRRANKEDNCKGHFWEGRFKSQALLDERALLACMVYVDLNPIRAGICDNLADADFTSIQARLFAKANHQQTIMVANKAKQPPKAPRLIPFSVKTIAQEKQNDTYKLPMTLEDYIGLTEWTGRVLKEDNKGIISKTVQPVLQELSLDQKKWVDALKHYHRYFKRVVGSPFQIKAESKRLGKHWLQGHSKCDLFDTQSLF